MAGGDERVDGFLRAGAVAALAGDGDVEERGAGEADAGAGGELADRHAGAVVQAVDGVAGEALEQAVLQHGLGAAAAFLGGLEDEVDGAVEVARFGQVFGGAEQHGGVAVVAAGVHAAGDLAGVRQAGGFLHRQRVHVGAQADRGLAVAVAQHADDAGLADAAMHLDAPLLQFARDQVGGAEFLQPEFGMGMDVAADLGKFVLVEAGVVELGECHRSVLSVTAEAYHDASGARDRSCRRGFRQLLR